MVPDLFLGPMMECTVHLGMADVTLGNEVKGSVKEPIKFYIYETEKITHKASDAAEYRVVRFFHPRSSCTTHLMLFSERPSIYASSFMTISGERTEQHIVIGFRELAAVD